MSIWERLFENLRHVVSYGPAWEFLRTHSVQLAGLIVLIVFLLRALHPFKALGRSRYEAWRSQAATLGHRAVLSAGHSLTERSPLIAFVLWLWLALWILGFLAVPAGWIILYIVAALCVFRVGGTLFGDLFAGEKAGGVLPLDDVTARFYRRRLKWFLAYVLTGIVVLQSAALLAVPIVGRGLFRPVFGVGIFGWAFLMLSPRHLSTVFERLRFPSWLLSLRDVKIIRALALLVLATIILMDLLGFHGLADYVTESAALTVVIAILAAFLWLGIKEFLEFLLKPDTGWVFRYYPNQKQLLEKAYRPSRWAAAVLLGLAALWWVLLVWGIGEEKLVRALRVLSWGPNVGPLRLTLLNIASAVLFIYLGFWLSRVARRLMEVRIYPRIRWDEGIRYSLTTTLQYTIMIIASLTALSALGFPLHNLALVAGALGVGVGFGLQSIVKDFVSGLILLFERPIKVGDMLIIDKQWGLVKAIRVRSTIFEVFDGYVLFIPNSELLSSKILNWTHNGWGVNRLTLTVGIGYGSDVKKATEVITQVCLAHPKVLKNPAPSITFNAFADSSLTMNIWVYIPTPAVRVPTTHELNSAILVALRANGIEVPFPQRDVYVKSWPGAAEQGGRP